MSAYVVNLLHRRAQVLRMVADEQREAGLTNEAAMTDVRADECINGMRHVQAGAALAEALELTPSITGATS